MIPPDFTRRVQQNPQIAELVSALEGAYSLAIGHAATYKFQHDLEDVHPVHQAILDKARKVLEDAKRPAFGLAHAHYATELALDAAARTGEMPIAEHVRCVPGMAGGDRE